MGLSCTDSECSFLVILISFCYIRYKYMKVVLCLGLVVKSDKTYKMYICIWINKGYDNSFLRTNKETRGDKYKIDCDIILNTGTNMGSKKCEVRQRSIGIECIFIIMQSIMTKLTLFMSRE
ncbi:uncharacterized protein T551_03529 [Pneumocystis jirovecii RU7]|uniref:Uncharacterized protein n=1 Tax=Pneumocystis jirovecii (strain RU7) TaxID=1408657 RepID=A0A0W4ZD38_PNEJ7|nr:uncharacterized protein T551_03529 [Pneumocystis jirovecii RU7]KTW26229.1 hypothetical protein T551_03529 [Pneumocystis jirovecii RU7]